MVNKELDNNISNPDFQKVMQEASELYVRKHSKVPELPLEFLEKLKQKKQRKRHKRALQAAALFMLVIVGTVGASIWIHADGAYGGKKFVNKCINLFSPLDIRQETSEDGSLIETATILDESRIEEAKDFAETLYVPQYIPEGYVFHSLTVEKTADDLSQNYLYKNGDKEELAISFAITKTSEDIDLNVVGELYISPKTGEKMYLGTFENGEYFITKVGEEGDCYVSGVGDVKEGIKVMENFKKY